MGALAERGALIPPPGLGRREEERDRARGWRWLAGVAVATLIALTLQVARTAIAPRTPWDENAIFQLARVLAGQDDVPLMLSRGYYPGTSVLLVPVYWFTSDPSTAYAWGIAITNLVGLATLLPLVGILRRLGLARAQAVAIGAITLCLPAYTALADYVLSEQLLTFLVVLAVYAAIRFWEEPGWGTAALLMLSVLGALFTHPRALVLVGVAAVWLLGLLFDRRRRPWAAGLVVLLVPAAIGVKATADHLASLVLVDPFNQGESLLGALTDPDLGLILTTTSLQTWAQLLGSLGALAFGAVVVVVWVKRELLGGRRFGPGALILGLALGGSALSWLNWATEDVHFYGTEPRFDSWVYTRYIAPFVLVVIALGLAALVRGMSRRHALVAIAGTTVLSVVVVAFLAPDVPLWGSRYGPANIAAIRAWERFWPTEEYPSPMLPTLTSENRFWLIASLTMLVAQIAMVVIARWPRVLVALAIPVVALYAVVGDENLSRIPPESLEHSVELVERALGEPVDVVSFEMECDPGGDARDSALNWVGFWFAPRAVDLFHPSSEAPESDVVVACRGWELTKELGARPVPGGGNYGYRVYVLPGPAQDAAREAGLLGG